MYRKNSSLSNLVMLKIIFLDMEIQNKSYIFINTKNYLNENIERQHYECPGKI